MVTVTADLHSKSDQVLISKISISTRSVMVMTLAQLASILDVLGSNPT